MSFTISFLNSLKKIPVPLFGTASTAVAFTSRKVAILPKLAPWALPLSVGGLWFVWPAVDEEWKQSIGLSSSPAAAPAPAPEKKVELSEEAKEKIEKAYVSEAEVKKELTEEEKAVMKAVAAGDYSLLEKDWEAFTIKAMNPEEDDDDEEEDDDDEEDEEEDDE